MPEVAEAPPITDTSPPGSETPPPPDPDPALEAQGSENGIEPPGTVPEDSEPGQAESEALLNAQSRELQTVSRAIIYREMNKTGNEVAGKTREEIESIQADPGKAALVEMYMIETAEAGRQFGLNPPRLIGDRYVTALISLGNGNFSYKYKTDLASEIEITRDERPESEGGDPLLTRDDLQIQVLLQEEDNIANLLPDNQRELFRTHAAILRDGNTALAGKTPAELDALIDRGAEQANLLTNDTLLSFAGKTLPPEQLRELLPYLSGGRLATAEGLTKVLEMAGMEKLATNQANEVRRLENLLAQGNLDGKTRREAERNLAIAREYVTFFNQAGDMIRNGTEVQEFVDRLTTGQVDPENAKTVISALKSGDVEEAVKVLFTEINDDPNDTPEARAEKKLKREDAIKRAKLAGGIGLLALLLLLLAGGEIRKST